MLSSDDLAHKAKTTDVRSVIFFREWKIHQLEYKYIFTYDIRPLVGKRNTVADVLPRLEFDANFEAMTVAHENYAERFSCTA